MSAVAPRNKQLGSRRTHSVMSASSHTGCQQHADILPWSSALHPVLTLFIPHTRTERRERMWTYCTCMWTFVNTSWTVFTLYLLPITSISQASRSQSMQSCCCLSRSGASCADRGPSRDIPERSCLNRAGKSWVFWTPFNDLQSYLTWVWYASTS